MAKLWLICNQCGYSKEVYSETECIDTDNCPLCNEGRMVLDMNAGRKIENVIPSFIIDGVCKKDNMTTCNLGVACDACPYNKVIGGNFPQMPNLEIEIRNGFTMFGNDHTWYFIEAISDIKLRLQYRETFFRCGGVIPKRS